jgi:hypothetical protein
MPASAQGATAKRPNKKAGVPIYRDSGFCETVVKYNNLLCDFHCPTETKTLKEKNYLLVIIYYTLLFAFPASFFHVFFENFLQL